MYCKCYCKTTNSRSFRYLSRTINAHTFKDAMPVTAKYGSSCNVKILQKKMNLLKMCGPQIRLCLFTLRPTAPPSQLKVSIVFKPFNCFDAIS